MFIELLFVINNKGEKNSNWYFVVKLINFYLFIGIIILVECIFFYVY